MTNFMNWQARQITFNIKTAFVYHRTSAWWEEVGRRWDPHPVLFRRAYLLEDLRPSWYFHNYIGLCQIIHFYSYLLHHYGQLVTSQTENEIKCIIIILNCWCLHPSSTPIIKPPHPGHGFWNERLTRSKSKNFRLMYVNVIKTLYFHHLLRSSSLGTLN
jgi:hypothetical protein